MSASLAPVSDADIFADEVLLDPYPAYAALREQGPAVYLRRYDCWWARARRGACGPHGAARPVESIRLDGPPHRHLNNVVRGLSSLPVTLDLRRTR